MKIKTSVPTPVKTKMIIPLTFHQIDFDWESFHMDDMAIFCHHCKEVSMVFLFDIIITIIQYYWAK